MEYPAISFYNQNKKQFGFPFFNPIALFHSQTKIDRSEEMKFSCKAAFDNLEMCGNNRETKTMKHKAEDRMKLGVSLQNATRAFLRSGKGFHKRDIYNFPIENTSIIGGFIGSKSQVGSASKESCQIWDVIIGVLDEVMKAPLVHCESVYDHDISKQIKEVDVFDKTSPHELFSERSHSLYFQQNFISKPILSKKVHSVYTENKDQQDDTVVFELPKNNSDNSGGLPVCVKQSYADVAKTVVTMKKEPKIQHTSLSSQYFNMNRNKKSKRSKKDQTKFQRGRRHSGDYVKESFYDKNKMFSSKNSVKFQKCDYRTSGSNNSRIIPKFSKMCVSNSKASKLDASEFSSKNHKPIKESVNSSHREEDTKRNLGSPVKSKMYQPVDDKCHKKVSKSLNDLGDVPDIYCIGNLTNSEKEQNQKICNRLEENILDMFPCLLSESVRRYNRCSSECSVESDDSFVIFDAQCMVDESTDTEEELFDFDISLCKADQDTSFIDEYDNAFVDTDDDECYSISPSFTLKEINEKWEMENSAFPSTEKRSKKVSFAKSPKIYPLIAWDFAYRAARCGPWEQHARDRSRFQDRIASLKKDLDPILLPDHRSKVWQKITMNDT